MIVGRILLVLALVGLPTGSSSGQDSLQAAKDLYASAAYEDALAILTRLQPPAADASLQRSDASAEIQQYRAFCLIALGRLGEAEKAIESVVVANPGYAPGDMDVPPRIQEIFTRTRQQLLPDIARQMYVGAKQALDRKDGDAAIAGFGSVVDLIDAADAETRQSLDELRFLAAGFLDLSKAFLDVSKVMTAAEPSKPVEAASVPAVPTAAAAPPVDITPPVAIRQVMPPWVPGNGASRQAVFTGAIRVRISAAGRVEGAEMVRLVHPAYDRLLLEAATDWEYQPARRGGVPIPSEQVVEVQLKPRQ